MTPAKPKLPAVMQGPADFTADLDVVLGATSMGGDFVSSEDIKRAVAEIHAARKLNVELQKQFARDSASWHQCETIDDRIHDALTALQD